ncbi:hypothetical protein ACET3Z_030605 [Daucus carota]
MDHFSHEHPLILNEDYIARGGDMCNACNEEIVSCKSFVFSCSSITGIPGTDNKDVDEECIKFLLHKTCAESPLRIESLRNREEFLDLHINPHHQTHSSENEEYPDLVHLPEATESSVNLLCEQFIKQMSSPKNEQGCSTRGRLKDWAHGVDSIVYLLNPMIRRAKNIGKIPMEVLYTNEPIGGADLCLGYYDGDYKVIKIVRGCGSYRVGVYSLSTNGWKILSCDSNESSFDSLYGYPLSKCVNGVAYFVKYTAGIVCFDLDDELIREIKFPEKFSPVWRPRTYYSFTLEECGESVALMEISGDGHLVKWGLRSCGGAESSWEKECTIALKADPYNIGATGLTYNSEYIVRFVRAGFFRPTNFRVWDDDFYLCDLRKSELKKCSLPQDLWAIDYLVGNLFLLNEQTLYPLVDSEATCTETTFVLCKKRRPKKKKRKKNLLQKGQNGMQG